MKVTWLVPDTYGFIVDELEQLAARIDGVRVLSSSPLPDGVRQRLKGVELHHCPECSFLPAMVSCPPLRALFKHEGLVGILRNPWHARKIAGIYRTLWALEQERSSDVIHSHFAHPGGIGGTLISGTPQLLTLRGYDILTTGSYGSLWNPFYRRNLIRSFSHAGTVTVGSSFSHLRARQILGSEANLRLLEQGVVVGSFTPAGVHTREALGLPEDAVVLLTVGNLVGVKNHRLLLEVFAKLCGEASSAPYLIFCGDGPLRLTLEKFANSLGLSQRVRFMGRLPREELTDLYGIADLFVHSSMSEGFGNVILEAILHRLPVVASPVGVAPDVIRHGENGFMPMLGDSESWVDCLQQAMVRLKDFDIPLETTRARVLVDYSMELRIEGFLDLYGGAIESNKEMVRE